MENSRQEITQRLDGVDFQAAAEDIASMFRVAEKEAASKGGSYIVKEELFGAVNDFIKKPNLENALTFLEAYPTFIGLFELTKDPLQIWARNFKKSHE